MFLLTLYKHFKSKVQNKLNVNHSFKSILGFKTIFIHHILGLKLILHSKNRKSGYTTYKLF